MKNTPLESISEIMTAGDVQRVLVRIAHEIIEKNHGTMNLALIGIRTRGEYLAKRLQAIIRDIDHVELPIGFLDVSFYRDDTRARLRQPVVQSTTIPFDLTDKNIVLVDDVLFTGRSVRAALDEIMDFGRPSRIQLAVLVDRGHRELPIHPDYVGSVISTKPGETVRVRLTEKDGDKDDVILLQR